MAERVVDGRSLEPAVRHAVVAARISADTVAIPVGVLDERAIRRRIAFIGQQIARSLPAEYVVRRIAPWRALVALVAGEKIQEKSGMIERPGDAGGAAPALEDLAEQLLAGAASQEHVLARRVVIAVAR